MAVDGGPAVEVADTSNHVFRVASLGDEVFWEEYVDACSRRLMRLPVGGTLPVLVTELSAFGLRELHVVPDLLFGIVAGCDLGPQEVWAMRFDGSYVPLPWRAEGGYEDAAAVAVTDAHVYWSSDGWPSALYRTARVTGKIEAIASAAEPSVPAVAIEADDRQAVWLDGDGQVFVVNPEDLRVTHLATPTTGLGHWLGWSHDAIVWTTRDYTASPEYTTTVYAATRCE